MPFPNLIGSQDKPVRKKLTPKQVGCEFCPLDKLKGVQKIFGEVTGKEIFIWGQSPGPEENRDGYEFVGKSGQLLWAELRRVGIRRSMCDIQNVVRCFPADRDESSWPPLRMRNPSKEEIHCCSIYNKQAAVKSKAKLHLVFGEIAAKSVLGTEYRKGRKVFWSEKLNGNVACLYHPSYFLRQGYSKDGGTHVSPQLKQFRNDLNYAATLVNSEGQFAYLKDQKYYGVRRVEQAKIAKQRIKEAARRGWRVAVDTEDGVLPEGRRAVLVCGFCFRAGEAYVFALERLPELEVTDQELAYNLKTVQELLGDPDIKKVMQHGSSDEHVLMKLMGVEMQGYDYDTTIGEYFFDPDAKAYGLTAIADRRFPEFVGHKEIIAPECFTPEFAESMKKSKLTLGKQYALARKKGALNEAQVPWKKMVLYNGADCDLTKRVEVSTKKVVNLPLMHIYRDASTVLSKMGRSGPLMDYRQCERLFELYPVRVRQWRREVRRLAGDKDFNPGSTNQVKTLLFDKLGLELPEGAPVNTQAETLEMILDQHEAVNLILKYRRDAKVLSTYLEGFKRSADMHEGRITTKWWLTGTRTGRLSSGAGKEKEIGLVNLQNIVSDAQLQNLVVSSTEWKTIYKCWKENGPFTDVTARQFEDMDVILGFDEAQFEIRVVAQRSGDQELIETFERGEDIHAEVGHQLLGVPKEEVMEEGPLRVTVKGMHFGLIYGLKAKALHASIIAEYRKRGITAKLPTLEWVQELLDKYFARYVKVARMIEKDHKDAEENGYVETMFGFRRPLNVAEQQELGAAWEGAYWKNQAANTPIQGTAHQLLLLGLVSLVRDPEKYKLLQRPKMEVHDAMYFFIKLRNMWRGITLGTEMLEKDPVRRAREEFGLDWRVPLKAEGKAGFRFGVQVKGLGTDKGPKTTAEFLNAWCEKNKKVEKELREEILKIR